MTLRWIKNALEKEASIAGFQRQHGDQHFEVVHECGYIDFFTKEDEITTIINDESGLQIFAILTRAQKIQILSDTEATSLGNLRLRCLQYKFDVRQCIQKTMTHVEIDDYIPGVDYQIVLILIEIEKNEIGDQKPKMCDQSFLDFKHWYYDCNMCRIFANTIRANFMALQAAEENGSTPEELPNANSIADERLEDQQNSLAINIRASEVPECADSSTVSNSTRTQTDPTQRNAKPPYCHTKPSAETENSRLNELMRPSYLKEQSLTNFSLDQTPLKLSAPGIVMEEDVQNPELGETGNPDATLGYVAASRRSTRPQNRNLILETPSEGNVEEDSDIDVENGSPDPTHRGASIANLEQENIGRQNEATARNGHTEIAGVLQNEQNLSGGNGNPRRARVVLEQVLHRNSPGQTAPKRLLNESLVRQPPDKSPRKRKKRAKAMYPIPTGNSLAIFGNFRCLSTFFVAPSIANNTDSSSDKECEIRVQRQLPAQTHAVIRHFTADKSNPSVKQNPKHTNGPSVPTQHKSDTSLVNSEQLRKDLLQHLTRSSSVSDSAEPTSQVPRASGVTQRRCIPEIRRDLQVSPELRAALLKSIATDDL